MQHRHLLPHECICSLLPIGYKCFSAWYNTLSTVLLRNCLLHFNKLKWLHIKKKKAEWFRTEPPYSSNIWTRTVQLDLLNYVKDLYTWMYLPSLRPLLQSESRKKTCLSFGRKIWKRLLKHKILTSIWQIISKCLNDDLHKASSVTYWMTEIECSL